MILLNGNTINTPDFSDRIFENGLSLYEVIRVFKKQPIFLQDNLIRLDNSIKKSNIDIDIRKLDIPGKLEKLIRLEQIEEGNLKYVLHIQNDGVIDEYIYQIPHSYPTSEDYRLGVDTMTCYAVRETPEIKYINTGLRALANRLIEENNVYEVVLIDNEGYITEGSRSNIFFIKNDLLYTASTQYVLPGTSRKRVFDICNRLGVKISEERVPYSGIKEYDAAFITGTSPLILPIRRIDDVLFDPQNSLLCKLMENYFTLLK